MAKKRQKSKKVNNFQIPPLEDFADSYVQHAKDFSSQSWVISHFNLRGKWNDLMKKAVSAALELKDRNPAKDLFTVFSILGHRWISHHDSIQFLLISGRYGEAAAICRMLLELTDLITYFAVYPQDVIKWREANSKPPLDENEPFKWARNHFAAGNIRKRLEDAGHTPTQREVHQQLNAAVHASEWGTYFYGQTSIENPGVINLGFNAQFNSPLAFGIGFLANQTLPMPIWSFLEICNKNRANKSLWRSIDSNYHEMLPTWDMMVNDVDAKLSNMIGEVAKLIASGAGKEDIDKYVESVLGKEDE